MKYFRDIFVSNFGWSNRNHPCGRFDIIAEFLDMDVCYNIIIDIIISVTTMTKGIIKWLEQEVKTMIITDNYSESLNYEQHNNYPN